MISRRMVTAGAAASLLAPSVSRGAAAAPLTFIPQSDLTILDPVVTTVYTARNYGYMVFDTLFGMDSQYQMKPQMLDGVSLGADGTIWNLTLREGLLWHDGEPVLARDCVASIRRWAVRDGIGTLLMARTDELSAVDDRTIRVRLKKPFPMLPVRAGKNLHTDVRDDAGTAGARRSVQTSERNGRQRAVSLQGGRVFVRRACGLHTVRSLSPQTGGQHRLDRRRENRAFRPGGMADQPG